MKLAILVYLWQDFTATAGLFGVNTAGAAGDSNF